MPDRIACLGPEGSFSHLITTKRFPDLTPVLLPSVEEVFTWLGENPDAVGVVPVENSSGGLILATIDRLMDPQNNLFAQEELTLDVKLAFLGHPGNKVEVIYSHYMPFFHCDEWLKAHYPDAKRVLTGSTSQAAARAATEPNAAAIGSRENVQRLALSVLQYPIEESIINVTQFFVVGKTPNAASTANNRTALVVELPDKPGILCTFLSPFSEAQVSLKRIESRPVRGQPNTYRFYIEIEGSEADPAVASALEKANSIASMIRNVGSYPTGLRFES